MINVSAGFFDTIIDKVKEIAGGPKTPEKEPEVKPEEKPAEAKPESKPEETRQDKKPEDKAPEDQAWISFLSQSLPVVGKVYDGDLSAAAKKIEAAISKAINKPVSGMIWNDSAKKFNTTPDDVKKALLLIEQNKSLSKPAFSTQERFVRLAKMYVELKNIKQI